MKKLFGSAAAVFASIPGLTIMISEAGAPPSRELFFGAVIEAVCVLLLLSLWVKRQSIKEMDHSLVVKYSLSTGVAFFALLLTYVMLFQICVVEHHVRGIVYYPIKTSGDIANFIAQYGSRLAVIEGLGHSGAIVSLNKMANIQFWLGLTTAILLTLSTTAFACLTAAFALIGFHNGKTIE